MNGLSSTILTKCDPHWGPMFIQRRIAQFQAGGGEASGLSERFRFSGNVISKQYDQVGNAVPALLARAVADAVAAQLTASHVNAEAAEAIGDHQLRQAAYQQTRPVRH